MFEEQLLNVACIDQLILICMRAGQRSAVFLVPRFPEVTFSFAWPRNVARFATSAACDQMMKDL